MSNLFWKIQGFHQVWCFFTLLCGGDDVLFQQELDAFLLKDTSYSVTQISALQGICKCLDQPTIFLRSFKVIKINL